jgi:acyl-CoA reductase-like NAD-dependent aldehyde dehydrogenase
MSFRTDTPSRRRDGDVTESGLGREGGRYGFDEFTNFEFVCTAWKAA